MITFNYSININIKRFNEKNSENFLEQKDL